MRSFATAAISTIFLGLGVAGLNVPNCENTQSLATVNGFDYSVENTCGGNSNAFGPGVAGANAKIAMYYFGSQF